MAETYESRERRTEQTESHTWPEEPLFRRGEWWWLASAIAIGVLLGLGSLEILGLIAEALGVVFLGATVAAALAPLVSWLDRYLPRVASVLLVYLAIIAILVALGWLVFPPLWAQAREAGAELPLLVEQSQEWIEGFTGQEVGELGERLGGLAATAAAGLASVPGAIASLAAALGVALFISFYWLIMQNDIKKSFLSLFPEPRAEQARELLAEGADSMGGYVRGSVIDSVIVGALTYVGLLVIGVDYALVLAVVMALFEIIPVVGATIGFFIVSAIAFLQSPTTGLITTGFMLVLQQLESNIVAPNVMSSQTDASPLLVLIAVFMGGAIGGFMGALIAIPLAAFLQVLFVKMIAPAFRRHAGAPAVEEEGDEEGGEE